MLGLSIRCLLCLSMDSCRRLVFSLSLVMRFKTCFIFVLILISTQALAQQRPKPDHIDEETWEKVKENRSKTPEEEERRFLTNRILLRDVGITLLASAGLIAFITINSRNNRQRNSKKLRMYKMRSTQAEMRSMELKNQLIKTELKSKEEKLNELLKQIKEKNRKLDEMKSKLTDKEKLEKIDVLNSVSESFGSEKEWEIFRVSFEQIHNGFFDKLLSTFPMLTAHELKLCALLRLNLSSKEIANILNISPSSVNTGRYRMRKKMHLTESDDLVRFLMTF